MWEYPALLYHRLVEQGPATNFTEKQYFETLQRCLEIPK